MLFLRYSWWCILISVSCCCCHRAEERLVEEGGSRRVIATPLPMTRAENRSIHLEIDPPVALLHDRVDIRCNYELEQALYSIKFYKDNEEIYRFIPRDLHPVRIFPMPGVRVLRTKHFHNWIRLVAVDIQTEGVFKCEVSSEGPSFETYSDEKKVVVREQPKDPPMLSYEKDKEKEVFQFKCTSPGLLHKGRFTWTVNDQLLEEENGDSVSILEYPVRSETPRWTKVECRLLLGSLYNKSSEVILFQDKAETLEVRSRGNYLIPSWIYLGVIMGIVNGAI